MPTTLLMLPPQTPTTRAWAERVATALPQLSVVVAETDADAAKAIARTEFAELTQNETGTADAPGLQLTLSEQEMKRELALSLYAARKLTVVQAADVAQLGLFEFQALLRDRRIPQHYDSNDLDQDLQALRELPPR